MSGVALITGASRGIGRAIAIRLAKDGFRVAINDLISAKNELEAVAKEITTNGSDAEMFFADVSVEDDVERMVDAVVRLMGGLDVMVSNAGICITKPFLETTKQDFESLFGINVEGTFFCYKYAAMQMIRQGRGGRIIGAASVASKQGLSMLSAYSASKFAVRGLTQSAAIELAKYNITVNAYAPGAVDTNLLKELREAFVHDSQKEKPSSVRTMTRLLDRDSVPEDIAGLVSYLASKEAAMITGACISVAALTDISKLTCLLTSFEGQNIPFAPTKAPMPEIAIVTGASRGIGRAIAVRLAKDGYHVAVNDLPSSKDELEKLQDEITSSGGTALTFYADVSVEEQVEKMVTDVVQALGGLDVMVANAGICITKPFLKTTKEDLDHILSVNIKGTFFSYKHAAIQMIKQGRGGRIIGAASIASKQGMSMLGAYSSTKFAIRGMTQSAAIELAQHNIRVNAYAPGGVTTDLLKGVYDAVATEQKQENSASVSTLAPVINRDSAPEEIAGLVSYLVSKDAAMITGQSVSINGGSFFD
ncbi:Short-chain dehydrogenase [Psilocybe cubensis]|uniref:NAD(P)-binding protein n=2 Tax=Psilocybe cubensis TaxID=181762 RepID=A0A8H7XNI7_PSICU|nr:Short-chain dehydrogenase [Psilocybe cubensis]KAH9478057.1 Short-chain dehydrogenase [Psilocybe cubensis]